MLGYWIGFVMALSAPVYSVSLGVGHQGISPTGSSQT